MPLDKSEIRVPFGGGIDTKTDHKNVIPGKLLELKNGVFHELKQITKRNGFETPFSDWTVDSDTIEGGNAIFRRGKELVCTGLQTRSDVGRIAWEDGRMMFSHGPDEDEWKTVGTREPLSLGVETIYKPSYMWKIPDVALADSNKYACYAWQARQDPADTTTWRHGHASVIELETDLTIIDDWIYDMAPIAAVHTEGVHVVGFDVTNPIFYVWLAVPSTNDVYLSQINCLTLSAAGAPVVKITDLHDDMVWDVCTAHHLDHGMCSVVAYKESGSGHVRVRWFDEDGTLVDTNSVARVVKNAITVYEEYDRLTTTYKVMVVYQDDAGGWIRGESYNANTTLYAGPDYAIILRDVGDVRNMTGCKDSAADHYNWPARSYLRLYVEIGADLGGIPAPWFYGVLQAQYQFNGQNPLELNRMRRCGLASKAWEHESKPRVWVVHDSSGIIDLKEAGPGDDVYSTTFQNTYFLRSPQGEDTGSQDGLDRTDARCLGGRAGDVSFSQSLSGVVSPETDKYTFAGLRQDVIIRQDPDAETLDSIVGISTKFGETAQPSTEMGPCVQTAGGYVGCADGRFQELGFHLYPMIQLITVTESGSSTTPATWQYCATYEWTDREGQIHRSAPSVPVEATAVNDDDHVAVTVACLHFGDPHRLDDIRIVLYRTENGGTVFYRLGISVHQLNDPNLNIIVLHDMPPAPAGPALPDATLTQNETLYTTGGEVGRPIEHICPPATSIMNVRDDRVLLVPDEDQTSIWFSKLKRHGQGVAFSDLFTKRITDGGPTTALVSMDTREVVFKEAEIRAFSGPGPNDLGQGGFGDDYLVTADVGCTDRASVCWTDKGILFKSLKGIYMLGRNLQVTYIGAPVEAYNQYRVIKTELLEDRNQVRFLLDGENMLVYDYLVNQWSVFEPPQVGEVPPPWETVDSAIWQNQYVMIHEDGTVYLEGTDYTDDAAYVPLDFTTSWIKLSGLQGFQRIWWISLLGEVYGECNLTVELSYNYVDVVEQTVTLAVDATLTPPAQLRIKPRIQKCEAVRIRVYDELMAGWGGSQQGFSLSDIMLQIGKKPGVMRQGAVKSR